MRPCSVIALAVITLLGVAGSLAGGEVGLQRIHFENSGASEAQAPFLRGVLLLHSFEYEDAAIAFQEAQRLDPDFALAYWGEAMTHNHPIWQEQEREAGRAVLERLAGSPDERLAKAPTERERDYLRAVEVLFGEGEKDSRDFAYLEAMRRLQARHTEDPEAAAFHALAILGTAHGGRDHATYMRAAAIAEELFQQNRAHPGAVHYLIHSYDDPIHAPLGLRAARVYSRLAPRAAHAQHMTSHIFVALGMWGEVVAANKTARDVQDARLAELGRPPNLCGHYAAWLEYGYLQQGRHEAAAGLLAACHERIQSGSTRKGEKWYFGRMRARYVLDTGDWEARVLAMEGDLTGSVTAEHNHDFVTAFAALKRGERDVAQKLAREMAALREQDDSAGLEVEGQELEAMLLLAAGKSSQAVEILERAAEQEAAMPLKYGPPPVVKPSYELLGEVLLELGRAQEARQAFASALARAPRRTVSLLGLARAAEATGDRQTAREAYGSLREIWQHADRIPEEVRAESG